MVGLEIFVISLRDSNRRQFQIKQFDKLNLGFNFLDACSTSDISKEIFDDNSLDWDRQLKISELACYFSHRNLWTKISQKNNPCLILEDDAFISSDIKRILNIIDKISSIDLINLENRGRKKVVSMKPWKIISGVNLYRLFHDTTGAAAYILWPSGAKKLLRAEKQLGIALADAQIYRTKDLLSLQIEPSPVIQLDMCKNYGIELIKLKKLMGSSVSSKFRLNSNLRFKYKRIRTQLLLGIKLMYLSFFTRKRYIKISEKSTFLHKDFW